MSAISLRLPDLLHNRARVLSKRDHVSINQFVATAVAEKISALETEDYLAKRAARASRNKFEEALTWHSRDPFPAFGTREATMAELSDGRIYYNSRRIGLHSD